MSLKSRIKTVFAGLLVTACLWTSQAPAAGTTPLSLAIQFDSGGNLASGCLLYFFVAGTVDAPQNAYSDFGLTQNPNPVLQCDQSGRVPQHWLADGLIHIRLTTSSGTPIIDATLQVLGPSSGGGGGGGTVDPTTVLATGDIKARYGTGPLAGFVRLNGLTIGNATSGATERANADTQPAFILLYNGDATLPVSGGRTGNALNDYNASKQIATPDWRGRAIGALADMGNSPTSVLTSAFFGTSPTVLGAVGGNQSFTLSTPNLPPYTPTGSVSVTSTTSGFVSSDGTTDNYASVGGLCCFVHQTRGAVISNGPITADPQGGSSTPFATVTPMKLATIYMKL